MVKYIFTRLLTIIPVLIGIVFLVFTIMYLAPGDPARTMLGDKAPQEQVDKLRSKLGLDRPYLVQFFDYLNGILRGDFGTSYQMGIPVSEIVLKIRFPITLILALSGMTLSVLIGIPVGILSAAKQYSVIDSTTVVSTLLLTSMPNFWLGLLLQLFLSLQLGLFPSSGFTNIYSLVLPTINLALANVSNIIRMTRSSMLEVIRQDFIRTARAKGAAEARVIFNHALKNSIIPVITVIGVNLGNVLAGAFITETIFSLPGLGVQLISAIHQQDRPVVVGAVLFCAFTYSIVNLFTDLLYSFVDPRIKI